MAGNASALADQIGSELRILVGQPIGDCWRAADMQVFEFGPRRLTRNRKGELVEFSEFRLHVQCRWRFVDAHSILFGRDDLNYPADETISPLQFDWDESESVLDVAHREWFTKQRPSLPVVQEVQGDSYGGFRIALAGGFALEGFPCNSRGGEQWRLIGHRADGSHFVVTLDGIEVDDDVTGSDH